MDQKRVTMHNERRKKKTSKRKRKEKNVKACDEPEEDLYMVDQPEEEAILMDEREDDRGEKAQDRVLAVVGLEDPNVEDDMGSAVNCKKQTCYASDEEEGVSQRLPESSAAGDREPTTEIVWSLNQEASQGHLLEGLLLKLTGPLTSYWTKIETTRLIPLWNDQYQPLGLQIPHPSSMASRDMKSIVYPLFHPILR